MRLRESGIFPKWYKDFNQDTRPCYDEKKKMKSAADEFQPLSNKRLSGAYVALSIGYVVSLLVLVVQIIKFRD